MLLAANVIQYQNVVRSYLLYFNVVVYIVNDYVQFEVLSIKY